MNKNNSKRAYVAIIGRPNVGKSSLINRIVGQKVGIVSSKPQTTRNYICAVKTNDFVQSIYIDSPGISTNESNLLHRYMHKAASRAILDADVHVFLMDARGGWHQKDDEVWQKIVKFQKPLIIGLNKFDLVKNKLEILPQLQKIEAKAKQQANLIDIIPLSAKNGHNLDKLEQIISTQMEEGEHFYTKDILTNRSERFLVTELIREQVIRYVGEEVPYKVAVEIESFVTTAKLTTIHSIIWVERPGQKAILIGKGGAKMKIIGTYARKNIEQLLGQAIMLNLWVKVKPDWTNNKLLLNYLGYMN